MATTDTTIWVARRIREARDRLGWSQSELASRLNRTQTAISYWEAGKRSPGLDDLIELADALQHDVSFFLPEASDRPPIRAVLRATAERLDRSDLDQTLQALLDEAEATSVPDREFQITSTRAAASAGELLTKAQVVAPPVDVDDLAKRCGARIVRRRFDDALSGLVIELDDGAVIGVNDLQSVARQRFTISHELGHYLLDHHDRFHIDLGPSAEHGTPPGYDWRSERAANDFAAELLMPAAMVHQAFDEQLSVKELAETFAVSELAMGYRLANLNLR